MARPTKEIEYVEQCISLIMEECSGFSTEHCDKWMCPECEFLDRNLKFESAKVNGVCVRCYGSGTRSGFIGIRVSYIRECNVCGGTGSFP
jgi:hypothetical protein